MSSAIEAITRHTTRETQRQSPQSFDDLDDDQLDEQTLAAIAETEQLLSSPDTHYYDSVREMFDDILGTDWRK